MKLYSALIKKDKDNKIEDISVLVQSFSILAFFFGFLWFLSHRMWRNAALVLTVNLVFIFLKNSDFLSVIDLIFLEFAFLLTVGISANHWYEEYLKDKNYKQIGYVLAQNEEDARLKAMKILDRNYPNLSFDEFSEAIIDPKAYEKNKKEPYFMA